MRRRWDTNRRLFQRTVAADTGLPPSVCTTPLKEEQIPGATTTNHALQT